MVISSLFFRQNHHGTISGRQLGEAAHRLVVNSLQGKGDYNGYGNQMHGVSQSYAWQPRYPRPPSYTNNRGYHDQEYQRGEPPRTVRPPQGQHNRSNYNTVPSHNTRGGYNEHRTPSAAQRHYDNNDNYNNRSHSQHNSRNNRYPSHISGERSNNVQYPQSGIHQNVGPPVYGHSQGHRPVAQIPLAGVGSRPYQGGGYNHYQNYQPSGASGSGHQWRSGGGGGWVPQSNQASVPRAYGRPQQQSGNHFSALDRRSHRPPPGYGR